jgi:hypothetical protein
VASFYHRHSVSILPDGVTAKYSLLLEDPKTEETTATVAFVRFSEWYQDLLSDMRQ